MTAKKATKSTKTAGKAENAKPENAEPTKTPTTENDKPAKTENADATKTPKTENAKPAKAAKSESAKPAKAAKPKKEAQPKETKPKKMSALDAAAKVLAEAGEPLGAKQMVEAMTAKGYWTSLGGKTPHATLYSAILREIGTKGKDARFKKTDRGRFAANG